MDGGGEEAVEVASAPRLARSLMGLSVFVYPAEMSPGSFDSPLTSPQYAP